MGADSKIEWTDATWNFVTGCTRVSAGCDNCYAFAFHDRMHAAHLAGKTVLPQYHRPFSEVQLLEERLTLPLRWTKPRRIFVNSMSDFFHKDVPLGLLDRAMAVMAACPRHTFQILTKRPQRMREYMSDPMLPERIEEAAEHLALNLPDPLPWPLPNVWIGVSVESWELAWRLKLLIQTPAAVRFVSAEPLIGPLELAPWFWIGGANGPMEHHSNDLDWIIVGGESGPAHRPIEAQWVRDIRDQCVEAGVPFFFKQWGGRTSKAGGRELDGRTWDEMPAVAS